MMKIASKLPVVALALCLPLAASPALARPYAAGYEARAQAMGPLTPGGVTGHRASALRECNAESGKLLQKDWGVTQTTKYAACMTKHGEME
jgi:hypothetical protein